MQREKEKGADTRNRLDPFSRNPRAPTESDREITAVVVKMRVVGPPTPYSYTYRDFSTLDEGGLGASRRL